MRGDYFAAGVIIVVGALLVVLAFTVLDDGGRNYTDENTMEFEDYRAVEGSILGVSGPLEMVTVDGTQYVHATGVGHGAIVYEDGTTDRIKVVKATADIVMMCGQSNAAYHMADASRALAPSIGEGFYIGWEDGMPGVVGDDVSDIQIYDFIGEDGELRVGDKGPAFVRTWNEITGHKVLWIPLGMSGRAIYNWDEGGLAWEKDTEIMEAFNDQLPEGFEIADTFFFWAQGEGDYAIDSGYQNYIEKWTSIHDRVPSAWGHSVSHWFLIPGSWNNCGWVNDAFQELADDIDGVSIATEIADTFSRYNGLLYTDGLHYTQKGDNAVAVACARACAKECDYALGTAPIYLQETIVRCDVGDTVSLGSVVSCRNVDGGSAALNATWSSTPSTSTAGIFNISGTSTSELLLDGTPSPLARVYVGYIGFVDGLEYNLNADGGATVIGRSYTLENAIVPSTVEGVSVTEIGQYALHCAPWRTVTIPDTVTTLAGRSINSTPILEALNIGSGLTTVGNDALSCVLYLDGTRVTEDEWQADPSLLEGTWEWDGTTPNKLYQETSP